MAARKKFPIILITGALALIMALAVGFGNSAQSQSQRGGSVNGAFSPTTVQVCPTRGDYAVMKQREIYYLLRMAILTDYSTHDSRDDLTT